MASDLIVEPIVIHPYQPGRHFQPSCACLRFGEMAIPKHAPPSPS
ncbi:MAG: hypothetical protein PHQ05_00285 [Sterolibacterium sp.]|nr:hypothetical protein [Sterolibacterium sp.]